MKDTLPKSPEAGAKGEPNVTLSYYADRVNLVQALRRFPSWSTPELAHALQRSPSWIKKWRQRLLPLLDQPVALQQALVSRSRAPHHPPARLDPLVEETLLAIRDQPPEGLRRTPGPKAINSYLQRDETLQALDLARSRSTRTIYRVLVKHQRIVGRQAHEPEPMERPDPLTHWQLDFKVLSSVKTDPSTKHSYEAQSLNMIDMGTSIAVATVVQANFTAETALEAVAHTFEQQGRPEAVTVDRDTKWVGSPQGSDFPSSFLRYCTCLGVEVQVCDPRHPQQNGFVERFNRSLKEECLLVDCPQTLEQAQDAIAGYREHYNIERPNQAISCHNLPPRTAFPVLPRLRPVPQQVDPDAWLLPWHGHHFQRKVDASGAIPLDLKRYGVGKQWRGQRVTAVINALAHEVEIDTEAQLLKTLPLKGLVGHLLTSQEFVEHMKHQARAQHRLMNWQERRYRTAAIATP